MHHQCCHLSLHLYVEQGHINAQISLVVKFGTAGRPRRKIAVSATTQNSEPAQAAGLHLIVSVIHIVKCLKWLKTKTKLRLKNNGKTKTEMC